ncbi:MAG TPA: hypothetical protein VOA80_01970 [Thermoanaerobaculia bacterium]|nr:hypothetical protein [Thermoanaerobaculia bacterium]
MQVMNVNDDTFHPLSQVLFEQNARPELPVFTWLERRFTHFGQVVQHEVLMILQDHMQAKPHGDLSAIGDPQAPIDLPKWGTGFSNLPHEAARGKVLVRRQDLCTTASARRRREHFAEKPVASLRRFNLSDPSLDVRADSQLLSIGEVEILDQIERSFRERGVA